MSVTEQAQIVELVAAFLRQRQPSDYTLEVYADGVRQEDDWWYVTVKPDRDGVRSHDYAELLTEVEEQIRREKQLNVLLVPVLVN